ncbi:MAG: DUF87 domain-containing protein [Lachnospiraceae bacterium]|nr:DUF87 domain-containing protein [Lachnospiraceae bacterium]
MRLIPGKTKVQIELFKGVTIWDIVIGALALLLVILIIISALPGKFVICCIIAFFSVLLLVRLDTQPNYIMVLHMIRHFGYVRRYARVYDDDLLKKKASGDLGKEFLEDYQEKNKSEIFGDDEFLKEMGAEYEEAEDEKLRYSEEVTEENYFTRRDLEGEYGGVDDNGEYIEDEEEEPEDDKKKGEYDDYSYKELCKLDKELRKKEEKILKSRKATPEEKDAVWLARANRSAAKKKAKLAQKSDVADDRSNTAFMDQIMAFTGIKDGYIEYGGKYYGSAIEIDPVEFRFFSEHRRDNSIESGVGRVLRSVHTGFAANIVKIERPIIYDKYLEHEHEKVDQIRRSFESGMMNEEEFRGRIEIMESRIAELKDLCFDHKVVAPFYYLVLFESDKKQLDIMVKNAMDYLTNGELVVKKLDTKELAIFLKYTNQIDFDERDIEKIDPEDYAQWAMPQTLQFKFRTIEVNHIITHNLRVVSYPSLVGDAWLAGVMSIPATKVVVKCSPMDRGRAIRTIDRSLQELRGQYNATGVDSKRIELENHIETLSGLLATLQGEGEELMECNIYVTAYDIQQTRNTPTIVQPGDSILPVVSAMKKNLRRSWQESNFRLNNMEFEQIQAFIGSQVSAYDPEEKQGRGIPSNSIAAAYPWIYAHISDEGGFKLGVSEGVPVFIDFFRRDNERVNSNMVIIGKSGSGKSYATKSLLSNLSAEDAKIFILDPENEYSELATNLHGKVINVANASLGRLNPFHIITALDDDEGGDTTGTFATHLQFLEEFYRQILPDIEKDALEYLNTLTERLYANRGITGETDLSRLRPEDYPIFDDLYDAVLAEFERTDNEYIRSMLRSLVNYISKFATGGRNANIWNGPSTVTTEENFTVFNFQAMLANRNTTIANAQMLLVLKYIDNEIIKNRDYNAKYKLKRKVVVVIDEAHVFIDTKFPVALDFMFQLAKRIRKYNGMQIVITQNIKDFVGSEEIARKSTAIINACQYSFIFALAPNDITDLCKLYEKAGGINELEQEQITQAPRGQAFTIMSPTSRSTFKVEVPKEMVDMFQEKEYSGKFFYGLEGEERWDKFVGESRELYEENKSANRKAEETIVEEGRETEKKQRVIFEEIMDEGKGPEIYDIGSSWNSRSSQSASSSERSSQSAVSFEEEKGGIVFEEEFEEPASAAYEQPAPNPRVQAIPDTPPSQTAAAYGGQVPYGTPLMFQLPISNPDGSNGTVPFVATPYVPQPAPDYQAMAEQIRNDILKEVKPQASTTISADGLDYQELVEKIRSDIMANIMGDLQTGTASLGALDEEGIVRTKKPKTEELAEEEEEEEDTIFAASEEEETEDFAAYAAPEPEEEEEYDGDEEDAEEEDDYESFDFSALFGGIDDELMEEGEGSDEDEDDESGEVEDDDDDFDIMALLRADLEENPVNTDISDISELVEEGEVADITFEELGALVKFLRNSKRNSY